MAKNTMNSTSTIRTGIEMILNHLKNQDQTFPITIGNFVATVNLLEEGDENFGNITIFTNWYVRTMTVNIRSMPQERMSKAMMELFAVRIYATLFAELTKQQLAIPQALIDSMICAYVTLAHDKTIADHKAARYLRRAYGLNCAEGCEDGLWDVSNAAARVRREEATVIMRKAWEEIDAMEVPEQLKNDLDFSVTSTWKSLVKAADQISEEDAQSEED